MTEQQRTEKLVVDLDHVRQNNIVFVDLSKPLTENVFSQEYEKAARVITRILDENEEGATQENRYCRECKTRASRSCEACKFRSYTGCRETNYGKHRTEYQTAVPFIGDRGTGKTSVMHSVHRRLRDYNGPIEGAAFNLGEKHDSVKFITFEMIDANTLQRSDDVMEIILARMLSYLDELQPDRDFRDLYRQIDELSSAMCKLRSDQREAAAACGLMGLQKVVERQSAIDGFQKLVEDFLKAMSDYKYHCRKCYLVIALDDIDMYQGSTCGMYSGQFALLEQVYNHMRIPGLIVLMTYNEHILRRICNRHFDHIYSGSPSNRKYSPTEQNDIDTLTGQFMSKLFPQEQRIYLPNFMLIDSANRSNLFVRPEFTEKGVRKPVAPFEKDEVIPVKEFMLRLIAHKTGVYFDAAGTKVHFFEPRNLRNLGELFEVIHSMEKVEGDVENCASIRERNRQALLKYMYNQFALRRLSPEEQDRFRKLSALPIDRQHRTMVDWIRAERMRISEKSAPDSFGFLAKTEKYRWRYSYGELLYNIYFATRIGTTAGYGEAFLSKAFMHCIFGTHSVILNNIIRSDDSRKNLLEIIGSSLSGRWANEMLPKFSVEDVTYPGQAGSVSLPVRDFFGWAIPASVKAAIFRLGEDRRSEEYLQEFFEALFFVGMFFTGLPSNGLGIYLDADIDENECTVLCLNSKSEDHICFNVMNFVINTYRVLPELSENKDGFLNNLEKRKDTVDVDISDSGYLQYMYQKLRKLGRDIARDLGSDWVIAEENAVQRLNTVDIKLGRRRARDPLMQSTLQRESENAVRALQRAKAWKQLIQTERENGTKVITEGFNSYEFMKHWNRVLSKTAKHLFEKFRMWEEKHKQHKLVLPVENFDMMYNIVKRLASVYYHDIREEASAEEVYNCYMHLYKSILKELEIQDQVYFGDAPVNGFAKPLRDSVFYQEIVEPEAKCLHTEFLREILTNMISSTISVQSSRRSAKAFDLPLL